MEWIAADVSSPASQAEEAPQRRFEDLPPSAR